MHEVLEVRASKEDNGADMEDDKEGMEDEGTVTDDDSESMDDGVRVWMTVGER